MTRRILAPLLLVVLALTACHGHTSSAPQADPSCTPPVGGQCAGDVAWRGPLKISPDGRRLHGYVGCGGTLRADETAETVTITLHVAALGPGMRTCALADVGVQLASPLGDRTVVDAVSGQQVRVIR